MIGPEKGRYRDKAARLVADAEAAEKAGFTSIWVPQVPGDFDALTAVALMGAATVAGRVGDRGGADPDAAPGGDGATGTLESGGVRRPVHARPRAVASLDRLRHARAARTTGPRTWSELRRGLERRVRRTGPGRRRERRVPRAQSARRHRRRSDPDPPRRPRSGDAAHRGRAARRGRSSGWPTSGRSASTSSRASRGGRRRGPAARRGSSPGCPSRCAATTRSTRRARGRTRRSGTPEYSPNYQRLLEHGDATDVGDICSRRATKRRSSSGLAASATRGSPTSRSGCSRSGRDRDARIESRDRTWRCSRRCVRNCDLRSSARSRVVVHDDLRARRNRLAGEDPAFVEILADERVVARIVTGPRRDGPCTSRSCLLHTRTAGSDRPRRAVSSTVSPA